MLRVGAGDRLQLATHGEALERELPDRLEHAEPAARPTANKALLDKRFYLVERGGADGLGRFEVEAAGEDGQAGEQTLRLRVEQVVAPLDGGPQRALTLGRVMCASRQERQPLLETGEQLLGRKDPHSRGGQLDRQGQPVQAPAELHHGGVWLEAREHRPRPLREQLARVGLGQRIDLVLPLPGDSQRRPARHEQLEVRTAA